MDLETENRIAAMLLKEAAELQRQAEKEGVHVYLQNPAARGRPNSRFLTATVLGVQQANRAVEINEMWRVRQNELELEDRPKRRLRNENSSSHNYKEINKSLTSTNNRHAINGNNTGASCSSSKRIISGEDEGLRDEEVDEFLHSRVKRGRGAVGSRMDETGPYLPYCPESKEKCSTGLDLHEHRAVLGLEKPSSLKSYGSLDEELDRDRPKKKVHSRSPEKKHSKKHSSKERSRHKKRKRKETKSKH